MGSGGEFDNKRTTLSQFLFFSFYGIIPLNLFNFLYFSEKSIFNMNKIIVQEYNKNKIVMNVVKVKNI